LGQAVAAWGRLLRRRSRPQAATDVTPEVAGIMIKAPPSYPVTERMHRGPGRYAPGAAQSRSGVSPVAM